MGSDDRGRRGLAAARRNPPPRRLPAGAGRGRRTRPDLRSRAAVPQPLAAPRPARTHGRRRRLDRRRPARAGRHGGRAGPAARAAGRGSGGRQAAREALNGVRSFFATSACEAWWIVARSAVHPRLRRRGLLTSRERRAGRELSVTLTAIYAVN